MTLEGPSSASLIDWAVTSQALAGQTESGDRHVVRFFPNGVLVGVVDGLGHGAEAARAAKVAVAVLDEHAHEPIPFLLKRTHEALKATRGAVISLASFHASDNTMTWLGVGNVEGILVRADPQQGRAIESILLQAGLIGMNLPSLRPSVVPVSRGDTLILVTDGISNDFRLQLVLSGRPQQIADRLCARHSKSTDDALVLVARYCGVSETS